jgi:hypothetical protein
VSTIVQPTSTLRCAPKRPLIPLSRVELLISLRAYFFAAEGGGGALAGGIMPFIRTYSTIWP